MIIYCSKRLETFLGTGLPSGSSEESSWFGDWNGHLFSFERKRCLLILNNKTCYSVVVTGVGKKDVKNFATFFRERLLRQLAHEYKISEAQEAQFRNAMGAIVLCRSNNDRKILGTINHHIEHLKMGGYRVGMREWDDVSVTCNINEYWVKPSIVIDGNVNRDYFVPRDLMKKLIDTPH